MGTFGATMDGAGIAALLGLGLALVGLVAFALGRRRAPEEVRGLRAAVRAARRARRAALRERARALATARVAVRRERRSHGAEVRRAARRVRELEDATGPVVATVGPVVLHERVLVTPGGRVPVAGVRAVVETSGEVEVRRRPTVTRAALGAAAFGSIGALGSFAVPKRERVDGRRVHLTIAAGAASVSLELRPEAERDARRFVEALERTSAAAPEAEARRAADLATARRDLATARGDVGALAGALAERDRVRTDPVLAGDLAEAEAALASARAALASARAARRALRRP